MTTLFSNRQFFNPQKSGKNSRKKNEGIDTVSVFLVVVMITK